jgi:lysosomal acid lipase/cholesteryl ester hydrolase
MGLYDLPAMIDYIIKKSNVGKISYIGHSQGTAQFFSAFTLNPQYFQSRINGFIGLGPITSLNNLKSTFLKFVAEYKIDSVLELLGLSEILPSPQSVHDFNTFLCEKIQSLCEGLFELLSDSNPSVDDKQSMLVFISHFPSGTSLQSLMHFGQIIRNKKFASLDSKEDYQLEKISGVPVCLLVGQDDKLSTVEDNRILRNILLQSEVLHFYKEYENMGHATFFLNKTSEYLDDVLRCLKDFHKYYF